jgi:hypothetical protein
MGIMVNHNYPGDDDLRVLDANGDPIEGVVITIFELVPYTAGIVDTWVGLSATDTEGRWTVPILVDEAETYVVHFEKPTMYGPTVVEITT